MQIFWLHKNPEICAQMHCDKHVVKMILESAQLLYSVHHVLSRTNSKQLPETAYKLTHKNHPCAIWARASLSNYIWLSRLAFALCKEYTLRYHKTHATEKHIRFLIRNFPKFKSIKLSKPAIAMSEEYKINDDPIASYRNFYIKAKAKFVTYKSPRTVPEWFVES